MDGHGEGRNARSTIRNRACVAESTGCHLPSAISILVVVGDFDFSFRPPTADEKVSADEKECRTREAGLDRVKR
jgi:hypothetical protein